jgi:hypothetical protein
MCSIDVALESKLAPKPKVEPKVKPEESMIIDLPSNRPILMHKSVVEQSITAIIAHHSDIYHCMSKILAQQQQQCIEEVEDDRVSKKHVTFTTVRPRFSLSSSNNASRRRLRMTGSPRCT